MKFIVSSNYLLKQLQVLGGVINNSNTLPILDNFLFEIKKSEIFSNFQKIADDLIDMGINVNCAPLLDVACDITHQVIGDRALGENPLQIITLAQKVCEALLSKKYKPVIANFELLTFGFS